MPKIKPYAVELDGLHVLMVAAVSKKAAAELIGTTTYMMTTWEGGMNDDDEAIALAEPGVVFRKRVTGADEWMKDAPSASQSKQEKAMIEEQTYPSEPLDHKRAEFEARLKRVAVERFDYSAGDALLKSITDRNRNGRYAVEWVRGAWEGFNMALPQHPES
ncbi:hypothetical protein K5D56_21750 [Pseudomonas cichorii]|nr:hypothetical protein [Pseudomonas cichorii]MBX8557093.1 hypothetical protein [Pseudomonas cichorii]MBX8591994.1 hypothetical protein [Pseudomonas cichorii]